MHNQLIAYRTGEVMQLQGHKVRILLGELATWVIILFALAVVLALFLSFI
jgi:tetrahydromethanopterin S-methyltransferase subunit G